MSADRRRASAGGAGLALALLLAVGVALGGGCRRAGPEDELPEGTLWAGDAASARSLLAALEGFSGSPAAVAAGALRERLAGCRSFLAACPAGAQCGLPSTATCEPAGRLAALADAARGNARWIFSWREGERRLVARGGEERGRLVVRATYRDDGEASAPWQALLPARGAPAPAALATQQALVHLHLRSDRALEALGGMGSGDWAERLFSLRRELFTAMALEGTAELAVYAPREGEVIPPLVLALHVRDRENAVRAMEELLARVRQRWSVTPGRWSLGGREGACLRDLNVLPELAPCYLAGERQVLVGWNERSVRLALAAPATEASPARDERDARSELTLYLDRFAAADSTLARAHRDRAAEVARYPWSRLRVAGRRSGDGYGLLVEALPAAGSGG